MHNDKIKRLQQVELEILKKTHEVCELLGIKYYLIGGTLLGAIRHGGFIPWDVDIDIAMPRKDYEIFKQYWKEHKDSEFFYQDYSTEPMQTECHALLKLKGTEIRYKTHEKDKYKMQCDGLYMDIFPLDFAPDDEKKQRKQAKQIKFWSGLIQAKICRDYGTGKGTYAIKKCLSFFLKPCSFTFLQKQVEKVMTRYNDTCSSFLVSMASHYSYKKQLMPVEIYGEPKKIMFDGLECYAPNQTIAYLEQLYKDYMKLPPEETRYKLIELIEYVDFGKYGSLEKEND